jgi:hypothetical protein
LCCISLGNHLFKITIPHFDARQKTIRLNCSARFVPKLLKSQSHKAKTIGPGIALVLFARKVATHLHGWEIGMLKSLQHDSRKQISRGGFAKLAVFAGTALAFISRPAPASIVVHDLTENTATGVYTYSITLDSSAFVEGGDGFVIEDFPGLNSFSITGGLTSAQFSETSSLLSNSINQPASVDAAANLARTADSLGPDDPTVPNLSFSYIGPPTSFFGATTATLTLTSNIKDGILALSVVAALDHSGAVLPGPADAAPVIPTAALTENSIFVPQPVPEPSPAAVILLGLTGLLAFQGRRISRSF